MERLGEKKHQEEKAIIEREDTKGAARIEGPEKVGDIEGIEQNACNEKTGKCKKKIDADARKVTDYTEEVQDAVAGV